MKRSAIRAAVLLLAAVVATNFFFSRTFPLKSSRSSSQLKADALSQPNASLPLDCTFVSEVADLKSKWFQTRMARDYTDPMSPCSGRQGLRRCHDVHSPAANGMDIRACQWRFPNGPCEDIRPEYREKLVNMSAKHSVNNKFPNVRLAWRTNIFGSPAWSMQPSLCARAEEIISCEFLSQDRKDGPIHGGIYHAYDVRLQNLKPDVGSGDWATNPAFLYNYESPEVFLSGQSISRLFHFRGDYSLDADYSLNYFQWNNPADIFLHQLIGKRENPFMHMFESRTGLFQPEVPFELRYSDDTAAPVSWVASHCSSQNQRERVVLQLLDAGLKIDILGKCMHNKDFPPEHVAATQFDNSDGNHGYGPNGKKFFEFMAKYKFYLNFENSNCKHYYTEKLRRSLILGVVPILLGHPADHEYILPHKDAAIKAWDFPNATALANYVNQVASDPALFKKHLAWKSGKREHISEKFWSYWSSQPASGGWTCQMCWIAYDVHLAKCGQHSGYQDVMSMMPVAQDTSCVATDEAYWGMHGHTLDTPNLIH